MIQYRDPRAAALERIAEKRTLVEQLRSGLPAWVRMTLPARIAVPLAELSTRATRTGDDLETLSAVETALDQLLPLYDEALGLAQELSRCSDDVEDYPQPSGEPPPWLIEEPWLVTLRELTALSMRPVLAWHRRGEPAATEPTLERRGDFAYVKRWRIASTPLAFRCDFKKCQPPHSQLWGPGTVQLWGGAAVVCRLRTSLPRALPILEVQPRSKRFAGVPSCLRRAVRRSQEAKTGDAAFDEGFSLHGSPATAILLVADARSALLDLSYARPALVLRAGFAELAWRVEGGIGRDPRWARPLKVRLVFPLSRAVRVLLALRRALKGEG